MAWDNEVIPAAFTGRESCPRQDQGPPGQGRGEVAVCSWGGGGAVQAAGEGEGGLREGVRRPPWGCGGGSGSVPLPSAPAHLALPLCPPCAPRLSSVKNRVLQESSRKDQLITKCNGRREACAPPHAYIHGLFPNSPAPVSKAGFHPNFCPRLRIQAGQGGPHLRKGLQGPGRPRK